MAQNTFALMTNLGRAKEAAAIANSTAVVITHIAIGDGTTVPSGGETALYHEVARKAISGHGTVVGASNVAYFDIFLEAAEGPYTIREAGLIDQDGDLIAIARYDPPISKPIPSSGQTVEGTIRLEVAFSNIANITIVIDPSFKVELQRISRLPWISVISMTETAPPVSPAVGDVYVIPTGATGAWSGQAGKIAEYTSAGWGVMTPPEGHGVSLPDGRVFERVGGVYGEKIAADSQAGKWMFAYAQGTANAITATLTPAPAAYAIGMAIRLQIALMNTGAATLNINGLGAKSIRRADQMPVLEGDLVSGQIVELLYDGVGWQISGLLTSLVRSVGAQSWKTRGTYTWIAPQGVTRVEVELWGAGGGGASSPNTAGQYGGAAGGGGYALGIYPVVPGGRYTVVVGMGGSGALTANSNSQGADGNLSSFAPEGQTALIYATGGSRGKPRLSGGSGGGVGTNGNVVNLVGSGGSGAGQGVADPPVGGGSPRGGSGGLTGSGGIAPGGGAAGAYYDGVPLAGADGMVLLRW